MSDLIVICPHCSDPVLIEKINCAIFRHGILIENGKQIDPHSSIDLCNYYIANKKIFGCGKPFQLIENEKKEWIAVCCDYI